MLLADDSRRLQCVLELGKDAMRAPETCFFDSRSLIMIARGMNERLFNAEKMSVIMNAGAERAIAESKRMGVPVPLDCDDGVERYELPDGTVVEGDPWYGQNTAPEGWFERFGITPENQPKVKK